MKEALTLNGREQDRSMVLNKAEKKQPKVMAAAVTCTPENRNKNNAIF